MNGWKFFPIRRSLLPSRGAGLGPFLGLLLQAGNALAADGFDEAIEISAAVIVGDLFILLDVLDRADLDHMLHEIGLGIRPARMVDVARDVFSAGTVDGPARVDLEKI